MNNPTQIQNQVVLFLVNKALVSKTTTVNEISSALSVSDNEVTDALRETNFHLMQKPTLPYITSLVVDETTGLPIESFWNDLSMEFHSSPENVAAVKSELGGLYQRMSFKKYRDITPLVGAVGSTGLETELQIGVAVSKPHIGPDILDYNTDTSEDSDAVFKALKF